MALTNNSLSLVGVDVTNIQEQILFANKTIEKGLVTFDTGFKSGTMFSTADVSVTAQLYTGEALTPNGSMTVTDRVINLTKLEYKDEFLQDVLRSTRYSSTMKPGAWNIESSEFGTKVLGLYGQRVSLDAEKMFWSGVTSTTKEAIASTTASFYTAPVKALVAAQPTTLVDGVFAKMFYDGGLPVYGAKIVGTTMSAANIADEYAKIYAQIDPVVLDNNMTEYVLFASREQKQLMTIANNSVGAASNKNFIIEKDNAYYNDVRIEFIPFPSNVVYGNTVDGIHWLADQLSDDNMFEVGKKVADGDKQYIRSIYTQATHLSRPEYGVIYSV